MGRHEGACRWWLRHQCWCRYFVWVRLVTDPEGGEVQAHLPPPSLHTAQFAAVAAMARRRVTISDEPGRSAGSCAQHSLHAGNRALAVSTCACG